MTEPLLIPESCFVVKADYWSEPGPEVISAIKNHIRAGLPPHEWPGHTHTRPPRGATVVYLAEFDVPAPPGVEEVAPCPVCSTYFPKYKRDGKIAWFPDEGVIRLIGPDCFSKLNARGHGIALRELRQRQKRERDIIYLQSNMPLLDVLEARADDMVRIAGAVDTFLRNLHIGLGMMRLPLWNACREGQLYRIEVVPHQVEDENGKTFVRETHTPVLHATVKGTGAINPSARPLFPAAKRAIEDLKRARSGMIRRTDIAEWTDETRRQVLLALNRAVRSLSDLTSEVREVQAFLHPATIATLRGWGGHEKTAYRFYIRREGPDLLVGRSEAETRRVPIPAGTEDRPQDVPRLA